MPEELPSSSRRPGEPEPLPSRAELRYPPGAYYRRIALGTVLPGAGLLGTRWKVLGWLLVLASLAGGIWVLVRAYQGGLLRSALNVAVQPQLLQWVGVAIMVGAVLWVGSIVLTAEQSWPAPSRGPLGPGAVRRHGLRPRRGPCRDGRALHRRAVVGDRRGVRGRRSSERRDVALANTTAEDPWADVPRVNTLLMGSDAGKGRWGTRTDSMMVVSTNTKTGDTLLIGIPRNLERVPFPKSNPLHALYPDGYNCGDQCLMNGIWTLAEGRPDLFPGVKNPGRKSTVDVVGEITGLDIQQSVVINLRGFKALVDAMGGVDVNVQQKVCVECHTSATGGVEFTTDKHEYIEPGVQHLDGLHALWYARSRAGSDDFSRMRRQRCVAGALMDQADPVGLLQSYPKLATVLKDNVSIDIPREQLPAWVDLALRIQKGGSIRSLPFTSDVVNPGNPDFAKIRALVKKSLKPPASTSTPSASPSATPTPTKTTKSSTPTPTATPDDSKAVSLAATC